MRWCPQMSFIPIPNINGQSVIKLMHLYKEVDRPMDPFPTPNTKAETGKTQDNSCHIRTVWIAAEAPHCQNQTTTTVETELVRAGAELIDTDGPFLSRFA